MPVLESRLIIGAKDETGGAFAAIQKHIASLDKQIATFDKLSAAARKVAGANDPMIASIDRGAKSLAEEKVALEALSRAMSLGVGSAEEMAAVQGRLARETAAATRAMAVQGDEASRTSRKIKSARESVPKGEGGGMGMGAGAAAMAGVLAPFAAYEGGKKWIEVSADLEQQKFRVRSVSHTDPTEAPFAEGLASDVAAKYPGITQAKALETYNELRANAANKNGTIDQATARRNMMAVAQGQTAALALGQDFTPEDAQNLIKSVEGTGRANDPAAIGKMVDRYIRAKQVFGTAITTDKIRDFVQNAKTAGLALDDEAIDKLIVRMTEGNASRLGNETAQTMQTLVGGHATKQTAKWLVSMGLATGFTPQGGGAATIHGLKGSDTLQVDQMEWANKFLLPALEKHNVLSEDNIKKREALLKKSDPNIDPRALRERAEEGLIAGAIAPSGMRSTVTDNLAHAIALQRLNERDVAQMHGASSSEQLAANIGQNPIAALKELTGALTNFASVAGSPMMAGAAKALDSLAHSISSFTGGIAKEQAAQDKGQPSPAGEDERRRMNRLVFGQDTNEGGLDIIKRKLGWGPSVGPQLPAGGLPDEHHWGPWHAGGSPSGPIMPKSWTPSGVSLSGGADNAKLAAASAMPVTVSGQAQVEHTVHVEVTLDPDLRAKIDQVVNSQAFTVPLIGGGTGAMDSDAGPHRAGGIGSM